MHKNAYAFFCRTKESRFMTLVFRLWQLDVLQPSRLFWFRKRKTYIITVLISGYMMSCAFRLDIGLTLTSFLTTPLMLVGGFYLNKGSVWRERDELKQMLRGRTTITKRHRTFVNTHLQIPLYGRASKSPHHLWLDIPSTSSSPAIALYI